MPILVVKCTYISILTKKQSMLLLLVKKTNLPSCEGHMKPLTVEF